MKKFLFCLLCIVFFMSINVKAEKLTSYETGEPIILNGQEINLNDKIGLNSLGFRGVWINTVWNTDFPRKSGLSEAEYKKQFSAVLDELQKYHVNAVIFQVRPSGDAFYYSELNPISQFLTGKEGENYTFDPLPWMIQETHKRGMEFHAWFNPYRVTHNNRNGSKEDILKTLSDSNWARNNPDSVFLADKKLYLKPWDPKVRTFIKDSIMEVVKKYNIDAVHLDDYFYPSKSLANLSGFYSEEERFYKNFANGLKLDYWRRQQVDLLIESLSNSITSYNRISGKSVQFGISPRGIWGNLTMHGPNSFEGEGVDIKGGSSSSFDDQFADTRKWVKKGWIDYIAPQVYWSFSDKKAPYATIVDWWTRTVSGTNVKLYIGHANYKLNDQNTNKDMSWKNPREIINQLKFNERYSSISGSIFFNATTLFDKNNFTNENRRFLEFLKNDLSDIFESQSSTSTGIKTSNELNIDQSVKVDYVVYKTKYGNMVQWVDNYNGTFSYYLIYRVTNIGGKEIKTPLSKIEKLSKSYVYIDKDFSDIAEYRIEAVR